MKVMKRHWGKLATILGASLLVLTTFIRLAWADAPALSIRLTGPDQVSLVVTNGIPTGAYEIYFQDVLDGQPFTNGTWLLVDTGIVGQTNFDFTLGDTDNGFFRAVNSTDFDMDGVPNGSDARPFDPSIGLMRVTIELPANGANVQ